MDALDRWRAETPGCAHRTHLNNAGAGLMPAPVLSAITGHLEAEARIGGYEAEWAREGATAEGYALVSKLVGAAPTNIAVTSSATTAYTQALSAFDFGPGDRIVTSRCDYISNQIQFLSLERRLGVRIDHAEDLPEGGVDPDSVRALLAAGPARLVSVTWVPTNSGLVQDVEAVGAVCREFGVPYLVDGCQAVGQLAVDVGRIGCDYFSATARKFLRGPRGIGFLCVSDAALARGDHPLYLDMRGARWTGPRRFELAQGAARFEDWEFPYALVLGLGEAARYALDVGLDTAERLASELAATLRERLAELPGVRVLDRGARRCAIVTAAIDGRPAQELVDALHAHHINTTATLREWAIYDMDEKGVDSALRISPHYYNTTAEIDRFMDTLAGLLA